MLLMKLLGRPRSLGRRATWAYLARIAPLFLAGGLAQLGRAAVLILYLGLMGFLALLGLLNHATTWPAKLGLRALGFAAARLLEVVRWAEVRYLAVPPVAASRPRPASLAASPAPPPSDATDESPPLAGRLLDDDG